VPAISEKNQVRGRIDAATEAELEKLADALKLKPLRGGAALQSRLETAYFDTLDGARPKAAQGPLTYAAALAAAAMAMTPPSKAELVADLKDVAASLAALLSSEPGKVAAIPDESDDAIALAEGRLLRQVERLGAEGKTPGVDPIRIGLKFGGHAALLSFLPVLGLVALPLYAWSGSWNIDLIERLVRASVLLAGVGERLRLEAAILAES